MSKDDAVAMTGIGLVTPAGIGVEATWEGVMAGRSTAGHDPSLAGHPVSLACRVPDFDAEELLSGRVARRHDRFVHFAMVAAQEALRDSGVADALEAGEIRPDRVGVVMGTADGGPETVEVEYGRMLARSPGEVSSLLLPKQLPNMLAGSLSTQLGATGPSFGVSTACASGATAVALALDLLRLRRCDVVVAGGSEAMITPLVMAGFAQMGALSTVADPGSAPRPFDVDRDGFVAGEGAGVVVLERISHARRGNRSVRSIVAGAGLSADAHHATSPHPQGRGLAQAIDSAFADARRTGLAIAHEDVGHVNAHGTGTPMNDRVEGAVLAAAFPHRPLVTSTKGVTGHMLGAAGSVEIALTALALERGEVPPTRGLAALDPQIDLEVATTVTAVSSRVGLSTSLGFGGQNAAVLLATPA